MTSLGPYPGKAVGAMLNVPKKISYATAAAELFTDNVHREGLDRGMIAGFSNRFFILQDFTTSRAKILQALAALPSYVGGRTRLYDSIQDVITAFWLSARRDCQWVFTALTDGVDNQSTKYPWNNENSPELIGRYVGQRFNHEPSNFPFLVGVGREKAINAAALLTIGRYGKFPAVAVEDFPLLGDTFRRIACQVTNSVRPVLLPDGRIVLVRDTAVQHRGIDYCLLIDCSRSMGEPVTDGKLD